MDSASPAWGGSDPFGSNVWDPSPPPVASSSKEVQEDTWGASSDEDKPSLATRSTVKVAEDLSDDFEAPGGSGETENDDFGDFGTFDDTEPFAEASPIPNGIPETLLKVRPGVRADEIAPLIIAAFDRIFPHAASELSSEPERQVGGDAQILTSEESRHLFKLLSQPPPVRPVDWKRSRVRREHLVALGVPVNVDEFAKPETPVLPPLITSVPGRNGASSAPVSRNPSVQQRPTSRASAGAQPAAPAIDRARASELLNLTDEQLTLLPLAKLEAMRKELQGLASDASANLTRLLERREQLASAGEAYDAKIQELVMAAQKLKPGPATSNVKRPGSAPSSSKWGRNSPNRPASPAFGGSGKR